MRNLFSRLKTRLAALGDWLVGEVGVSEDGEDQKVWRRRSRRAERTFELVAIRELSPVEARQADELHQHLAAIRTVKEPVYDYLEPIGPKRVEDLTVDERWQLFEQDPLAADLPGAPAKDNVLFAEVHAALSLSKPVAVDLELTRGWEIGQLRQLAQMAGKAER
jgi:hypothetical protein